MESEPELSWLMLVSSVETAANGWWKGQDDDPEARLRESKPELCAELASSDLGAAIRIVAKHIADSLGVTRKFLSFLLQFLPDPPRERPAAEWCQHSWMKEEMRRTLRLVYKYRSQALHDGVPFPAPMCEPPLSLDPKWPAPCEKPIGLAASMKGGGVGLPKTRRVCCTLSNISPEMRC